NSDAGTIAFSGTYPASNQTFVLVVERRPPGCVTYQIVAIAGDQVGRAVAAKEDQPPVQWHNAPCRRRGGDGLPQGPAPRLRRTRCFSAPSCTQRTRPQGQRALRGPSGLR